MTTSTPQTPLVSFLDLDSLVTWRRGPAAVAAVTLRLDGDVRLGVDAAFTDRLLAVTAPPAAADALAEVFGPAGATAWQQYVDEHDGTALEELRLPTAWARRFEVEAVLTLRPTPLDRGVLALDEAQASAGIDDPVAAARVLSLTVGSIENLVDDLLDEQLPETLVVAIENALTSVAPLATASTRARLEDGIAALDERTHFDGLDLELFQSVLDEYLTESMGDMAVHAGDGGAQQAGSRYPVDLFALPARQVAWSGAGHDEVFVVTTGENLYQPGAAMTSQVYVDVHDVDDAEQSLCAFVADGTTGRVLRIAPMHPTTDAPEGLGPVPDTVGEYGGRLTAALEYTFPAAQDGVATSLRFGVIDSRDRIPGMRADRVGAQMVKVDRRAVDAWHSRREAATASGLAQRLRQVRDEMQKAAGILDELAETLELDAEDRMEEVDRELGVLTRILGTSTRRDATRLAEVARARRRAWSSVVTDAPVPAPLLSEFHAVMRRAA